MADQRRTEWFNILRRFLGKSCTKNYKHIILDLISVSTGLKPSLLFDYTCLNFEKAQEMLQEMWEKELLIRSLDVICLGQDIFIANLGMLVDRLKETLRTNSFFLVDATGSLPKPCVVSTLTYSRVVDQFSQTVYFLEERLRHRNVTEEQSSSPALVHLNIAEDWNLTSLYGFFLTYPVIYWFVEPSHTCPGHNCLALTPLTVHTVKLNIRSSLRNIVSREDWSWLKMEVDLEHTLFSYSVPVDIESCCRHFIHKWKRSLSETAASLSVGNTVDFNSRAVVLKQVAL